MNLPAPLTPEIGVGLRAPHFGEVLRGSAEVDFFEVVSENFMVAGGNPLYVLDRVRERYPIVLHGVSLGIGSPEEPDREYLRRLKQLIGRVQPRYVTDHFCWSRLGASHLHDLLPLPLTAAMAERIARRANALQDYLEVPFGLENTSTYARFACDEMSESEFINAVLAQSEVGVLLDVNNVFVSACNHGFDAHAFVEQIPAERVLQLHMAGHTDRGRYLLDTHHERICAEVWQLYQHTLRCLGPIPTLIEWDEGLRGFDELCELRRTALTHAREATPQCSPQCSPQCEAPGRRRTPSTRSRPQPPAETRITLTQVDTQLGWFGEQVRALRARPSDAAAARVAEQRLAPHPRMSGADQLEVYREQFWLRHTGALLEDFPALAAWLGQTAWEALVEGYLLESPLRSFSLRDLGAGLAAYVAALLPDDPTGQALATLEWAQVEVFDASDALRPLGSGAFISQALRVLELPPEVDVLRRTLLRSEAPQARAEAKLQTPFTSPTAPDALAERLCVYRTQQRTVASTSLAPRCAQLLQLLTAATSLELAFDQYQERGHSVQPAEVRAWFAQWAKRGWLTLAP